MTIVYDQFDTEPLLSYSGSIFDSIFFSDFRNAQANDVNKLLVGSSVAVSTLLPITGSLITTASLRIFGYNSNTSSIFLTDPVRTIGVLTSDLMKLYQYDHIGLSAKYSIAFSPTERYTDSVMPEPILIYLSGATIDSDDSFAFGSRARGFGQNVTSSCMVLCSKAPIPLNVSNKGLGNLVWQNDFPFEPKYKNITRNSLIDAQIVKQPTAQMYTINNIPNPSWNISPAPVNTSKNPQYKNSIVYWGLSDFMSIGSSLDYFSLNNISRSLWELEEFALSSSSTPGIATDLWVSGVAIPPSAKVFNLHFFGFGNLFGKFAEQALITESLVYANTSNTVPVTTYPVATGTFLGVRLSGFKYGVYSPIPAYTKAIFRHNHFGFFRDMLEQGHNTTFFDTEKNVSFQSPVSLQFLTSSQVYLTASSPDPYLNNRSSGMFDFNYRAGRPFFD